jgi:hypothetical protein
MLDELFWLFMEGSAVAYAFVALVVTVVCGTIAVIWFYHKLPAIAKQILWNELRHHNPLIANCYDDQLAELQNPPIYSSGVFWQKNGKHAGWHFHPELPDELMKLEEETLALTNGGKPTAKQKLAEKLEALYRKAFHLIGTSARLYFAYSGKAEIVNPEILAILEHPEFIKKVNEGEEVSIKKDALLMALKNCPDDYIQVRPMFLSVFLDPRSLKQWLPQSFKDTQLQTAEELIRRDERSPMGGSKINAKMAILVCIIGIAALAGIYVIGHYMGYF